MISIFSTSNVVLVGELSKVVPISPKRVRDVTIVGDQDVIVTLVGAAGETVYFHVVIDDQWMEYTCVVRSTGDVTLQVVSGGECEMKVKRDGDDVNRLKSDIASQVYM